MNDNIIDYNEHSQPLRYGSFGVRFVALILDGLVFGALEWFAAKFIGHKVSGFMSVCLLMVYHVVMETSERQATWGKVAMGLKVTDEQGRPISAVTSLLRCGASYVSAAFLFIGYMVALFSDRNRTLHDAIAGTVVVYS
jgi:uncharacterized RDD family membrane protein YckC